MKSQISKLIKCKLIPNDRFKSTLQVAGIIQIGNPPIKLIPDLINKVSSELIK